MMTLPIHLSFFVVTAFLGSAQPSWVQEIVTGAAAFWDQAATRDMKSEHVRTLMEGIENDNQSREQVEETIQAWKSDGVDIVAFLRETVEAGVLPAGEGGRHEGLTEVKVLRWLARTNNPSVTEWMRNFVNTKFSARIDSRKQVIYLLGLLMALGSTQSEEVIDYLLLVQSKEYWEGETAPRLDLPGTESLEAKKRNLGAKESLRRAAINAMSENATEKAIKILGTGQGIAVDLQGVNLFFIRTPRIGQTFWGSTGVPKRLYTSEQGFTS